MNFGHRQNIDRTFNSDNVMRSMVKYIRGARIAGLIMLLSQDEIDSAIRCGAAIEENSVINQHGLTLCRVILD